MTRSEASQALCLNEDPEEFFHSGNVSGRLRRLCSRCPIRAACLEEALESDAQGFWGGLSKNERDKIKRKRAA